MSKKSLNSVVRSLLVLLSLITIQIQCLSVVETPETGINDRPIIGILSQEISYKLSQIYGKDKYHSFIAASYVKFVESAGAQVVPIWIGMDVHYYENIMNKINGILLPGGATWFNQSGGYADAGDIIYRIAKRKNEEGNYFPILGICLGFELLTYVAADRFEHRSTCSSHNQALPLEFTADFEESRMFGNVDPDMKKILRREPVTANYHGFCVTQADLKRASLTDEFRILSFNEDRNNLTFISSFEHFTLPFYGLQFHPEKNVFEWAKGKNIPHGKDATKASRYFGDFFVREARKSANHFDSSRDENKHLIYNYKPDYTGEKKSVYEQCYLFTKSDRWSTVE